VQSGNAVTITFAYGGAAPLDPGGSLIDGGYQLTVVASNVQGVDGSLDGNGDGIGGDNYQTPTSGPARIFRLFGDGDGSGTVDVNDFRTFRQAIAVYDPTFDFDGLGSNIAIQFGQFRQRFGTTV